MATNSVSSLSQGTTKMSNRKLRPPPSISAIPMPGQNMGARPPRIGRNGNTSPTTVNDSYNPVNIAEQKAQILSRVETITMEYAIPASNPDSGGNEKGTDQAGNTASSDLRTHLSSVISLAAEAGEVIDQEKEKLTSLLDWFFETRSVWESDNPNEDPEAILKQDASFLLKVSEPTHSINHAHFCVWLTPPPRTLRPP